MSTVIGILIAFLLFDGWATVGVLVAFLAFDVFEIWLWLRWRNRRSITGSEALPGATGTTITDCRPEGQVKVRGQIWKARCDDGVGPDRAIVVAAVDGMTLVVEPAEESKPIVA